MFRQGLGSCSEKTLVVRRLVKSILNKLNIRIYSAVNRKTVILADTLFHGEFDG